MFLLVVVGWFWLCNKKSEKDAVPCASTRKSAHNNGVQDPCFVFFLLLGRFGMSFWDRHLAETWMQDAQLVSAGNSWAVL